MKKLLPLILITCIVQCALAQNLFPFKKDNVWGYMDSNGVERITPQFPMAGLFNEGLAYAQIGEALGFIDVNGKR